MHEIKKRLLRLRLELAEPSILIVTLLWHSLSTRYSSKVYCVAKFLRVITSDSFSCIVLPSLN